MSCVWVKVGQAADHLQVHFTTVKRWLQTGQLKGYKPGGRDWRICLADLNAFATERSNSSVQPNFERTTGDDSIPGLRNDVAAEGDLSVRSGAGEG